MAKSKDGKPFYLLEIVTGNVRVHFTNPEKYKEGSNEVIGFMEKDRGSVEWLRVAILPKIIAIGEGKRLIVKPFDSIAWVTDDEARHSDKTIQEQLKTI